MKLLKNYRQILIGLILLLVAITATSVLMYNYTMQESGISEQEATRYSYYYVIITDNSEMSFWQAAYGAMKDEAAREDAFIEILGENLSGEYSVEEKMQMAIESGVHGIILEPGDDPAIAQMIDLANAKGIPVVTVMSDEVMSDRISYVGTNSYDLGREYGKQVLGSIDSSDESIRDIVVFVDEQKENSDEYTVFTQINEMVEQRYFDPSIRVTSVPIDASSSFNAENEIRDYLINREENPDLIVCLNAVNTVCVYQAVVDFNLVGKIQIIGDHFSDTILKAIQMGNIYSTLVLDAEQMGVFAVNALTEYREMGYVSDFYRVDVSVIDKSSVDSFVKEHENEEDTNRP